MRFISMHKADAASEAGTPPSQELIQGMGALVGEMASTGRLIAGEGLRPSSQRVRVTLSGGKRTVARGPLTGTNEVIAAVSLIRVKSLDDAVEWATRYGEAAGASELEVGPVTEAYDLGFGPPPDPAAPKRFLVLRKSDRATESGSPLDAKQAAAVAKLLSESKGSGVLQLAETLAPSAKATRVVYAKGKKKTLDGPFAESKELIGGFCMLRADSKDEVLAFNDRFAKVFGDVQLDVFPLVD